MEKWVSSSDKMENNIYSPEYVGQLFERMSATYDRVNRITSFGFSVRWRRQCVRLLDLKPGMTVADFMTGMGEAWPHILAGIGTTGQFLPCHDPDGRKAAETVRRIFHRFAR
jgi:demethylmenaquinone methyltransferase/2-methoxy-6-polyprenyl-1,4-benzoquinol methylase